MTTVETTSLDAIQMATFNMSTLSGTYQALNGTGFGDDIKVLKIYNDSDKGVTLSYDGSTDQDYMPAKSTMILDIQANHACNSSYGSGTKYGRKGQIIWGKGSAAATVVNIYIIGHR